MQFADSDFPLPDGETGDIVFNTDCNCLWCHDGSDWKDCNEVNSLGLGSFNFACDPENPPLIKSPFYTGERSTNLIFVPVQINSATPGPVTLTVNDKGFAAQRTFEISDTSIDQILINPIHYDGSGVAGTTVDFEILSAVGIGSCFARAAINDPGAFTFDCNASLTATGTIVVDASGSTDIDIPITVQTPGDVTIRVKHNGFTATEYVVLETGQTTVSLDSLAYDGSQTQDGLWSFAVTSEQATGICFGNITLDP